LGLISGDFFKNSSGHPGAGAHMAISVVATGLFLEHVFQPQRTKQELTNLKGKGLFDAIFINSVFNSLIWILSAFLVICTFF
jgi:hypothetical protein